MQRAARNFFFFLADDVEIGEIDGEKGVVVTNGRTEKQRCAPVKANGHAIEVTGLGMKKPQPHASRSFDVAIAVKYSKSVAELQNAGAIVGERRGRQNVVLSFDADDVGQCACPLLQDRRRRGLVFEQFGFVQFPKNPSV
jgi:hypothetical protein